MAQTQPRFFDEVFEQNGDGTEKLREAYARLYPIVREVYRSDPGRVENFAEFSLRMFQKDNSLYHLPRMLSQAETAKIHSGVRQRAEAFRLFILDHYFEGQSYAHNEVSVIPATVVQSIVERSCEEKIRARPSTKDKWGFWYGPDLIRGPDGDFYVVEDNLGYVGGMGDLVLAQDLIRHQFPEYQTALVQSNALSFFQQLADTYRRVAPPGQKVVILHYPNRVTADNEEKRVLKLFKKTGIDSVVIPQGSKGGGRGGRGAGRERPKQLEVVDGAVFFVRRKRGVVVAREPVGVVVIDAEAYDVDPTNARVRRKTLLDEANSWLDSYTEDIERVQERAKTKSGPRRQQKAARKVAELEAKQQELSRLVTSSSLSDQHLKRLQIYLRKNHNKSFQETLNQGVPGLLKAFFQGRVALINGPGFDFIGDKLFATYADELIRHYLHEEPILKTIPTLCFGARPELIDQVFSNADIQERVVVKRVDGRGGDAVWVGPKIPRSEFVAVRAKVLEAPDCFIVQQYTPLSQVEGQLVDIRVLSNVTSQQVIVSEVFWGRGVPAEGSNGKVNISDRGFEFAVCTAPHH